MGVVPGDASAEPERIRDAERVPKDVLDLVARQPRIAGLHVRIEETLFGREQRTAAVDVDAAPFQDDLRVDQRELETLRRKHGDLVVLLPVLVLGPGVEMEAGDGEIPSRASHEDRAVVARPAAIRGEAQKIHALEIDADLLENPARLSLVARGVDENPDDFAPRERADD